MCITAVAVGATVLTAGAIAPAAVGAVVAAEAAVGSAVVGGAAAAGAVTGTVVGTAVGSAVAAGAAGGAAAGAAAAGGVVASAAGGAAGGAIASAGLTGVVGTGAAILSGPVGWLVLGAASTDTEIRWDCWRKVLREPAESHADSLKMRTLRQVSDDARISKVSVIHRDGCVPEITLSNIFGEDFEISFVILPGGVLALHATQVERTTHLNDARPAHY